MLDSLWRISENSPAYNSAVGNYPMVEYDMDGQLRDFNKDIGADEFSLDAVVISPRNRNNSGPSWLNQVVPVAVSIIFNGGGKVEYNPAGGVYEIGTEIELTAIPNEGGTFDSWSGDISSTENPVSFTVNGPMTITANFINPIFYKYTLFKSGSGTVTVSPNLQEFPEGSSAIFTAVPADGWRFKNWNGSLLGN